MAKWDEPQHRERLQDAAEAANELAETFVAMGLWHMADAMKLAGLIFRDAQGGSNE